MTTTEQYKDKVFFSQLLRTDYPNIYKDVCEILDANNVAHETLPLTKDYWCRDYMPIQFACGYFSQFVYNPDYLKGKEKYITDVVSAGTSNKISKCQKREIKPLYNN